jgi:predicted anti-sigma-YlaC factor YlaD
MMGELRTLECERTRQWVSAALDSELSQFERALVKSHVARCAACRAFEEGAWAVTAVVRSTPPEALSHPVYLPARRRLAWRSPTAVARLGSAAAAVVVSVISVGLLTAPESGSLDREQAFAAASLEPPAATNQLVIGVRSIGAYKPALAPSP